MGFLKSVSVLLRPAPDRMDSQEVQQVATAIGTHEMDDKDEANVDIEAIQKRDLIPQPHLEAGVARVEAVQTVWGKRGKFMIIAG